MDNNTGYWKITTILFSFNFISSQVPLYAAGILGGLKVLLRFMDKQLNGKARQDTVRDKLSMLSMIVPALSTNCMTVMSDTRCHFCC